MTSQGLFPKKLSRFYLASMLLLSGIFAAPIETSFSSDEVAYEEDSLSLKGNVFIENLLGSFRARSAKLTRSKDASNADFLSGAFKDSVQLQLAEDKTICCELVDVNFAKMHARLSAGDQPVTYKDSLHNIELKSSLLECFWEEKPDRQIALKDLIARDSVEISYLKQFTAFADKAHFYKRSRPNSPNLLHGILELTKTQLGAKCLLKRGTDEIQSDKILFDTKTRTILFKNPAGTLSEKRTIAFAADRLIWRPGNQLMVLSNNIEIEDSLIGRVLTKERMEILQDHNHSSFVIDKLRSKGLTHWKNGPFSLTCDGKISYDAGLHQISAHADRQPLEFFYHQLSIQSMRARLSSNAKYRLPLYFEDSVFISNYALSATAEIVEIDPKLETIRLIGRGNKRVLFWDKKKDLQISADEIILSKLPRTAEHKVEGKGRVQLRFEKEDFERLSEVMRSCIKSLS